jgi:hypothetical protein
MHEIDGDANSNYWHIFRSEFTWSPSSIDPIIRLVADDRISNVMIVDPLDSWLVHPYDGGIDVIASSIQQRDDISSKYDLWRSVRADGM